MAKAQARKAGTMKRLLVIATLVPAIFALGGCRTSIGTYSLFGGSTECGCGSSMASSSWNGKVTVVEPPLAPTSVVAPVPQATTTTQTDLKPK